MFDDLFTATVGELSEVSGLRGALLDVLFDQMPIGMALVDRNLTLVRVNSTWSAFMERYAPLATPEVAAGTALFALFPDERERFLPGLERAFSGEVIRHDALIMQRDGITSYWDVVVTPQRQNGDIRTLLIVVTDASDRVFANRLLEEKEALYRGIFEATSEGVIILAASGRIVEANPAACAMYGYPCSEMIGRPANQLIQSLRFDQSLNQVLSGSTIEFQAINYRRSGQPFNVDVHTTPFMYRGEPHILSVVRDSTERVQAFQILEQRVEERTHELSTLLKASNNIASTLALRPLLSLILNELRSVIEYSGAGIFGLRGDRLVLLSYRGPVDIEKLVPEWPATRENVLGEVIHQAAPLILTDIYADSDLARKYRLIAGEHLRYARSWMGIPLIVRQRVIGMLGFNSEIPGYFTTHLADLALAFASQAAVAMDNSRLYEEEQERRFETEQRRRVAEGMRDILNIINSNRSLDAILDFIVVQAARLLGTESIAIFGYQPDDGLLTVQTATGLDDSLLAGFEIQAGRGIVGRALLERQPALIADLTELQLEPDDPQYPFVERWKEHFTAVLAVPMIARDQIYGEMLLYYPQLREFSDEDLQLVISVCDQAALAIENGRLRAQAAQSAVAAERSRLARELHDAVTQTLFSASLIAEVLPRLWERDREEGLRRLTDLRQLTRGALAEMRTLLLELRPATLTEVELRELLRQLCEALTGRARIPVLLDVAGTPQPLPPDVQITFYRVAQEALNNIFKHANASEVHLRLEYAGATIALTITDNGCGFDPDCVAAESLGLKIMRERAEGIGAAFRLSNPPEGGTQVALRWSGGSAT